ncbi:MAG: MarR family transcriptional regulator [Acidimicrobiia bacterium]
MTTETDTHDVLDGIIDDVFALYPGLEVSGLPITGRVMRLARYLEALREQWLGEFGLTVPDFDVLATMRRTAGNAAINVRELQRSMMLSSGGATKRVDRLERAGLVERLSDPNDRRGVLIRLTPAGLELIDQAMPAITAYENEVVGNAITSARRRDQVADGLRRLLLDRERTESKGL